MTPRFHWKYRLLAVIAFLAGLWAVFHFSGLKSHISLQLLHDSFEQHWWSGLLIFTALFALGNLIQIPGWLFLAAAVLALGQWWGGLATYVAACGSSLLSFWVIRGLGGDALRELGGRYTQRLFARLDAKPLQSVLLLRVTFQTAPTLNLGLALSGVSLKNYVLGTALGLPLPILAYTVFFDQLAHWLHLPTL